MIRRGFFISIVLFICILFSGGSISGTDFKTDGCTGCHEKIYTEALDSPYPHSVAKDRCELCHIVQGRSQAQVQKRLITFPFFQKEGILYLDNINSGRRYLLEAVLTDDIGTDSRVYRINLALPEVEEYSDESFSLKHISDVTLEEVKKGVFAEAAVSWLTDAPATSEIEYRGEESYIRRLAIGEQFTKKHMIILNGLKNNNTYYYRVVSRDIYGNMLKSGELSFDTSENFSRAVTPEEHSGDLPMINSIRAFRTPDSEGIYLMVSANKPSRLSLWLTEIASAGVDDRHAPGLAGARYSAIEVCKKCHIQNASHPVGVRAKGEKVRTPDDLPTIEDGVITCVTCHLPHGGRKMYFARMDMNKDICIKCHIKGYEP